MVFSEYRRTKCTVPQFRKIDGHKRKTISGFSNVALITLLPLLLALFWGTISFVTKAQSYTQGQSACIKALFAPLDAMANELNKLLDLNKSAAKLRVQLRKAELQLQMAQITGNEPKILYYERKVVEITMKQSVLDQKQKQILQQAELARRKIPLRAKYKLQGSLLNTNAPPLQVTADVPTDLAPVYLVDPHIRKTQTTSLDYLTNTRRQRCEVSIEHRHKNFRATLVESAYER